MSLNAVPVNAEGVVATMSAPVAHLCPFVDEDDLGWITARWRIHTHTLELHALRAHLEALAPVTTTDEELTLGIAQQIAQLDGLDLLSVITRWTTAGIDITCEVDGAVLRQPQYAWGA